MKSKSKLILSAVLMILLSSCTGNDDNNSPVNPGTTISFKTYSTNDTLNVDFEVTGTTTSQPLSYENLSFSSEFFAVAMNMTIFTNGTFTYKVFKDTIQVFSKTYSNVTDTVDFGNGKPSKVQIIPNNFAGKGIVQLRRSF